jgi:hypothetical protein
MTTRNTRVFTNSNPQGVVMNGDLKTPVNPDALLESFAAELAVAAYRVALQTRARGTWLDLELDLWRALADKVNTWRRELPAC